MAISGSVSSFNPSSAGAFTAFGKAEVKKTARNFLPSVYGDTKVVLLPIDPLRLYAYWEISQDLKNSLAVSRSADFDANLVVVRVYDVTDKIFDFNAPNPNNQFDLYVGGNALSWHIDLGEFNRSICAHLGYFLKNGEFIPIAKSNIVKMPRYGVSALIDENWLAVDFSEELSSWFNSQNPNSLEFMRVANEKWKNYMQIPGSFVKTAKHFKGNIKS